MDFCTRLKELLTARNVSQIQFARELGVTRARLNHYICGRSEPSNSLLVTIARKLDVSTDYLLGGTRSAATRHPPISGDVPEFMPGESMPEGAGWMALHAASPFPPPKGTPAPAPYGWVRPINAPPSPVRTKPYALFINDDSMSPEIMRGDIVFIQPRFLSHFFMACTQSRDIFPVRLRASDVVDISLKRCHLKDNKLVCTSSKVGYRPVILDMDQTLFVPIVGMVKRICRSPHGMDLLDFLPHQ